jgi:hypothetical protein
MQASPAYTSYQQLLAERQGKGFSEYKAIELLKQVLPLLATLHTQRLDTLMLRQADYTATLLQPPSMQFEPAQDVFDLGIAIVQLLTAQPPEILATPYGNWQWEEYCFVSDQFAEFLNRTLSRDPGVRYANAMQTLESLGGSNAYIHSTAVNNSQDYLPNSLPSPAIASTKLPQLAPWQWLSIGIGAGLLLILAGVGLFRLFSPQPQAIVENPKSSNPISNQASTPTPLPTVAVTSIPNTPTSTIAPTPNSSQSRSLNLFENTRFPQYECGDPLPKNPRAYPISLYPVYVDFSDLNLQITQSQYCQDALKKPRKDSGKLSVQVASFAAPERANAFRDFLSTRIGTAEVGEPTVITSDRAPAPATQISTERVNFDSGTTKSRLERSIASNQSRRYLLNCSQGQLFTFILLRGNANVTLYSPGGRYLGGTYKNNERWAITLQEGGDYIVEVSAQNDTGYAVDVEVL